MNEIFQWFNESKYINTLSTACKMCSQGSKLVVFITGVCSSKCFYCPLSFEKGGNDSIFADEWKLENENDTEKIILEAEYIKAAGAGITGGDPLIVWKRTKKYISLLKDKFGSKFHIHLYTPGIRNGKYINDLISVGLDEIRFHPSLNYWHNMNRSQSVTAIKNALATDVDVAIEIPAIPNKINEIVSLIIWANDLGIKWINLNELESSERNINNLNYRNYVVNNDISAAVKDSKESANEIIEIVSKSDYRIGVHYCSCSFKDRIQLANRIKRRAKSIAKNHEFISIEGTLIKGIIHITKNNSLNAQYISLKQEFNLSDKQIFLNMEKKRIEIDILLLNKIASILTNRGMKCYMIEEYPTADNLEVQRIPLPL
jgi:pyruvate formate-lyase activating enzyme-like uncharacterized protein